MKHVRVVTAPKEGDALTAIVDYIKCVMETGDVLDPDCTTPLKCELGKLSC